MKPQTVAPFFVVGCGRSGTTLLRAMLNAHPEVAVPPESLFILDYLATKAPLSLQKRLIVNEPELAEWGLSLTQADLAKADSSQALIQTVHELYAAKEGKKYWGQKTPRFVRFGGLLHKAFPHARFIHVVRNPYAVASSLMHSPNHRKTAYAAAQRWQQDVAAGHKLKKLYPKNVIEISYENLVTQPEKVLKKLCRFLGLPYSPVMLTYHTKGLDEYKSIYTASHKKLREQPDTANLEKWRAQLSKSEIHTISSLVAHEAQLYHYKLELEPDAGITGQSLLSRITQLSTLILLFIRYSVLRPTYIPYVIYRKVRLKGIRTLGDLLHY